MADPSLTNSFTSSQWYAIFNTEDQLISISSADTFVTLDFSDANWQTTSNYNDFAMNSNRVGVNLNYGVYLLNVSFNSKGATNKNLAMAFNVENDGANTKSTIFQWNSKGGNIWSLNHSAIMPISGASSLDKGLITLVFKNSEDTVNFTVFNLCVTFIKLM